MNVRPDAVVFDMDGLLLDTERVALETYLEAGTAAGIPVSTDLFMKLVGRNWRATIALLEKALGTGDAGRLLEIWTATFEAHVETRGIPKKPGVDELLDLLQLRQTPVALATSTARDRTLAHLSMVGLGDRFRAMATGDEVANGKPSPDIYLLAADRLGVNPEQCVAVEDSEPGVEAADAAGMRVILVPDLKPPTVRARGFADHVCRSLAEVRELLGGILGG